MQNLSNNKIKKFRTVPQHYDPNTKTFKIDFDIFEKSINNNTRLLFLCNPNNPFTNIYTKEEYEKITEIIRKFPKIRVMEDLAYFPYLLNNKKITYFASIGDNYVRTISSFSLAKVFGVTGSRLGLTFGSKENIERLSSTFLCNFPLSSPLEQMIFSHDLDSSFLPYEKYENYWTFLAKDTEIRFNRLNDILKKYNLKTITPEGTYYIIINVENYKDLIPEEFYKELGSNKRINEVDKAFCRMLLSEGVGTFPMTACQNWDVKLDNFVRIAANRTFEDFEIVDSALSKISKKLKTSNSKF